MALAQAPQQKPTVFLSFAGEDVEWKRTLMQPTWWAGLSKVAAIYDYDDTPTRAGDLQANMGKLVGESTAFVVLLSKFYIRKEGIIEHEFKTAIARYQKPEYQDLFCVIIIDTAAKQWWDERQNSIFAERPWLQNKVYWDLIENNEPANLAGDLKPRYARQVRDYAEKLAKSITASSTRPEAASAEKGRIIVLGRSRPQPTAAAGTNASIAKARSALATELRNRHAEISEWDDGWTAAAPDVRDAYVRQLLGQVNAIVRPVGPDETFDVAVTPGGVFDHLQYVAGGTGDQSEIRKIKTSLWLPDEYRDHPDAKVFVERSGNQAADANPLLCVAAAAQLAERLVPLGAAGKIAQICVEELDDIQEIEVGRTARKIVEEELRKCLQDGARRAKLDIDPPVRQFLNYRRLANQITEAKGGRVMLVAHDLQEHVAASFSDARQLLERKVRNLKETVEGLVELARRQIVPIVLVVTNYKHLQNEVVLDEEIAGIKWWLLPGEVREGRFTPEDDIYERVVENIRKTLQGPGAGT
jgi:hypothetical protein